MIALSIDATPYRAWPNTTLLDATVGIPVVPSFPTFPETNLRTYVSRPNGRDRLWFLSEVASAVMLAARCAVGAPDHLGDLSLSEHGGTVVYAGARRGGEPSYHLQIRPGERIKSLLTASRSSTAPATNSSGRWTWGS